MFRVQIESIETDDELKEFISQVRKQGYLDIRFGKLDIHEITGMDYRLFDNWVALERSGKLPIYIYNDLACKKPWAWSHADIRFEGYERVYAIETKEQLDLFMQIEDIAIVNAPDLRLRSKVIEIKDAPELLGFQFLIEYPTYIVHGKVTKEFFGGLIFEPLAGNMTGGDLTINKYSDAWVRIVKQKLGIGDRI